MTDETTPAAAIEVVLDELRTFPPPESFKKDALVVDTHLYDEANRDFEGFWARQAAELLTWHREWDTILEWDLPFAKWFVGGQLNVSYNCLDRHVEAGKGDKVAYHWEGEPGDTRTITYADLLAEVQKLANVLKSLGVERGDRVNVYLPMIPELPVALLACARIGAAHSVVFGGFSPDSLSDRINDAEAKVLITADGGWRRGAVVPLKANSDVAVAATPSIEHVIVVRRTANDVHMEPGRDHWYHDLMAEAAPDCPAEPMDSEQLLYLLYTSGTTAKPKGIMHTSGGYLTQVAFTHKYVFDLQPDTDVYWCAADIGWVTGHSYIVYGPLANGATSVMYEGTPDHPARDRWWDIIERYGVTILYTAPTAIRTFMKWGAAEPAKHDLTSLRLLGSVGEPINPEAWMWYHEHIGGKPVPGGRHVVADRDGGHHDQPAAGMHDVEARLGDLPAAGHRRRPGRRRRHLALRRRRLPHAHPAVAVHAPGDLRRPGALPGHLLEPLPRPLLRRRRGQARRRRVPVAARARRRRHERERPPHLHDRGRVVPRGP